MTTPKVDQLREQIAAAQTAARQIETTATAAATVATEARDAQTSTELHPNKVTP